MTVSNFELALLKIPVTSIKHAAAFYGDVLGMHEEFVMEEYGWAQFKAGELPLALYKPGMGGGDATPGGSTGFHLTLLGEAFDSLAKKLSDSGALVDDQVHTGDDNSTFLEARDPDGNTLKVMRMGPAAS